ncbi:MAG: hypothetical protein ABIT38_23985 [Gemmatimonadaceae bacterium]
MSHDRRRFLGWLGQASVLGAIGIPGFSKVAHAESAPPHPVAVSDTWDLSWVDRVSGEHRAVFDSPEAADGAALFRAVAWCDQYKEVYNVERSRMSPVLVLRHTAISLAVNNDYWQRFNVGKELKMKNEKGKWAETNPLIAKAAAPDDKPSAATGDRDKYTLERFMADGGVVLACAWAFGMITGRIKKEEKLEQAAAAIRAREFLIPGIILQPNGIFAVIRAQEAGCQYVMAS